MDIQLKKSDRGVANLLKNINHAVKSSQHFRSSLSSLINSGMAPTDHSVASNHHHQAKRACSTNSSAKKGGTHVASSSSSQSDCSTRAFQSSSTTLITSTPDHDGYIWRKYGEKKIAKSMFPRSYYRCTYHTELDCKATKQVQQCSSTDIDDDLPMYKVTYFNQHTCNHSTSTSTGTGTGTVYTDDSPQILAFTANDNYSSVKTQDHQQQQLAFPSAGSSSSVLVSSLNTQQQQWQDHHQDLLGFESTSFGNELISGFDLPYDMDELLLSDYTMDD